MADNGCLWLTILCIVGAVVRTGSGKFFYSAVT